MNRPIRAAKVVRATMESMELLLEKSPNYYVIHLIRDPRAAQTQGRSLRAAEEELIPNPQRTTQTK